MSGASGRLPSYVSLRLSLHPIRRTVKLSLMLARPEGFPERVTLMFVVQTEIEAYDLQRYDDLDLPWIQWGVEPLPQNSCAHTKA